MVVNCPNCECPNDADQGSCRECGARIPWSMRKGAIVPKQQQKKQRREYSDGDVVHRQEQGRVMHKTGDDLVGHRQDVHTMRNGVKPREGGISAYSPNQYAPPPSHDTATRTESGRKFVDHQAYQQQQVGYTTVPPQGPPPSYTDPRAWQAEQGGDPYTAQQAYQGQVASTHANHGQGQVASTHANHGQAQVASTHANHGQAQAPPGHYPHGGPSAPGAPYGAVPPGPGAPQGAMPPGPGAPQGAMPPAPGAPRGGVPPAPRQQHMPGAPGYGGYGGRPSGQTAGQAAAWQNGQISIPSEHQTAQAMAAASMSDPQAALHTQHGAPGVPPTSMPTAPARPAMPAAPARPAMPAAPARPASEMSKPVSGEAIITEPSDRKAPPVHSARAKRPKEHIALVFLDNAGNHRERLPIRPGKTIIGRSDGEVMLASDPYVSPWHAQITVGRSNMIIKDMFSLNGIYRRISRQAQLQDGDKFLIGQQVLQFRHGWHEAEPDAQETRPLGGLHPSTAARVLVLTASGDVADLRLIRETLTIGRSSCDVNIPEDDSLEDKHVQIQRYGDEYLLIDLNSADGVYLMIRGEAEIGHGDTIRIGRQRLLIERPGSTDAS